MSTLVVGWIVETVQELHLHLFNFADRDGTYRGSRDLMYALKVHESGEVFEDCTDTAVIRLGV